MLLEELLRSVEPRLSVSAAAGISITGICDDSRQVRPGDLFIARAGPKTDGSRFIADAAARGAIAVVVPSTDAGRDCVLEIPRFVIPDPAAAARVAHQFFGQPSRSIRLLGVTGTNGKTTTTYLLRHILNSINLRCGMIGTVEIDDGATRRESDLTTPGAIEIARLLAAMRDHGCRACAMETSSHALHQGRLVASEFAGAAFTNLTGDHLDYHGDEENYGLAKAILFRSLEPGAVGVVNARDPWSARMVQDCRAKTVRYGMTGDCDYRAQDIVINSQGTRFTLKTPDGEANVAMGLIGRHNVENALAAAALACEVFAMPALRVAAALSDAPGAPGRLQPVRAGQPFAVLVDYAHTDDALVNVLTALRPLTRGSLRVVFGCGGDRDRTKRPRMAQVARKLADVVYVTSDNPRTENADSIIAQIVAGLDPAEQTSSVRIEPDRRKAIELALGEALAGDVVLLAGKGHENYQIIGTTKHHFDDVEEAAAILRRQFAAAEGPANRA
jgi:UDP-N-acetylmuramoyl-L-alanyl-D-glutamate--2,6-diaminopimelate ligase